MTTRYNPAFSMLVDLAADKVTLRTQEFTRATAALRSGLERLHMLEQHRAGSQSQFDSTSANGISIDVLRNHQNFFQKLDHAIVLQRNTVSSLQQSALAARQKLNEAERKRLGFTLLESRQLTSLRQQESKRDQKNTDEHAATMARRK